MNRKPTREELFWAGAVALLCAFLTLLSENATAVLVFAGGALMIVYRPKKQPATTSFIDLSKEEEAK